MYDELIEFFVDKINKDSPRFTACIPKNPRQYRTLSGTKLTMTYRRGFLIERKRNMFCLRLPKSTFVFEPDLNSKVIRKARSDKEFMQRYLDKSINSDDVESIVRELTHDRVVLHLRGRTIFEEDNNDL